MFFIPSTEFLAEYIVKHCDDCNQFELSDLSNDAQLKNISLVNSLGGWYSYKNEHGQNLDGHIFIGCFFKLQNVSFLIAKENEKYLDKNKVVIKNKCIKDSNVDDAFDDLNEVINRSKKNG